MKTDFFDYVAEELARLAYAHGHAKWQRHGPLETKAAYYAALMMISDQIDWQYYSATGEWRSEND